MSEVVVAGGGLAGLVAARHVAEAGHDVTLYEAREEVGGRVRTVEKDGFVLDRGFQVLFTAYPAARRELDYDDLQLGRFRSGAIVAEDGRRSVVGDPFKDPMSLTSTLFSDAVSVGDMWRLLQLRRRLQSARPGELLDGGDAETIREGLREAGFSERFLSSFVAPFYGGITLDRSLSTSLGVFKYTFRMLAEGAAAVPGAEGMAAIPRQLADRARDAGAHIETGTAVEGVDAGDGEVSVDLGGETDTALAALVATDPPSARDLTGVDAIPTAGRGCVTQFYSLPSEAALETDRRILLNAEDDDPNQVVPHSEVAPGHAPAGRTLVSATFLGADDRAEGRLADLTRDALARWYPERTFGGLETVHTERVPFAQFAQPPGFRAARPATTSPEGPVVLAGDYTQWSSIQGALESGREAGLAALDAIA
jgi:phytoene dehydrogenase-like protein